MINLNIPEQYAFLIYKRCRYKVAYGGRSSAKSTSFIRALLYFAGEKKNQLILCTRETQNSIRESVHRLIATQIHILGLAKEYEITYNSIRNRFTNSQFIFYGLKTNPDKIKSIPNINIAYVEEADKISDASWDILIPTVREKDSEIWIVFNANHEDDPVYQRFVVDPPESCHCVKVNYNDLPAGYLSQTILDEAAYCQKSDPLLYNRIWLGNPTGAGGHRVWTAFDENIHVKSPQYGDFAGCTAFMAMDPHSKYFPFCVWVARKPVDNTGKRFEYIVYNEWPEYDMFKMPYHELRDAKLFAEWGGLRDLAQQIFLHDGEKWGMHPVARYIDTRYAKGAGGTSWSTGTQGIIAELAKVNLHFIAPAERIIDVQREKILDAMRYNPQLPMSETNRPLLYIAPWCRNMITSMRLHRTEENSERETEKYKDASDALRICFAGMSIYKNVKQEVNYAPDYAMAQNDWMS